MDVAGSGSANGGGGSEYEVMYYCIRAGKLEAAIRFAKDNNIAQELISVLVALERQSTEGAQVSQSVSL